MAETRSTQEYSGPRSTEECSAAGCSKRPSFGVTGRSKRMPCDKHVQASSKQASKTMGPPGTQSAASSKRPGVALGTVRTPRNLGPPQRAKPLQPPFPTASPQEGSISSKQPGSGVPATTAAESLCSQHQRQQQQHPQHDHHHHHHHQHRSTTTNITRTRWGWRGCLRHEKLGPRRGPVIIGNRLILFRVGILVGDSNLTE